MAVEQLVIVALTLICIATNVANVALVVVLTRRGIGTAPIVKDREPRSVPITATKSPAVPVAIFSSSSLLPRDGGQ